MTDIVEADTALDGSGQLDGQPLMLRRRVGYRQNQNASIAMLIGADGRNDGAGTILAALLAPFEML